MDVDGGWVTEWDFYKNGLSGSRWKVERCTRLRSQWPVAPCHSQGSAQSTDCPRDPSSFEVCYIQTIGFQKRYVVWKKKLVGYLRYIRNKVVAGRELPPQLTAPPWRVPSNRHPKASMINAVLSKSMEVQSSHVPECHGHGDFQVSAYYVIKMKFANCELILHMYGQYYSSFAYFCFCTILFSPKVKWYLILTCAWENEEFAEMLQNLSRLLLVP